MKFLHLSCLSLLASFVSSESTFSPARPPAIPLAVKSPYLSTWQAAGGEGGNGGYLVGQWPTFWAGAIIGWTGLIRVDGQAYTWMGAPDNHPTPVNQTDFTYTSTQSIFTMDVGGKVTMKITFLSPVTPEDEKRMSMPFSYMVVDVLSRDGKPHNVQLYTDVSGEWASGDRNQVLQWEQGSHNNTAYHKFYRQNQKEFAEDNQQAAWGNWYYSTADTQGLSYQSGIDTNVRTQFTKNGLLQNIKDAKFRAINDGYPVFGFAKDLGTIYWRPVQTVFTISLAQKNAIQFTNSPGNAEKLPSLWTSYFSDELDALAWFFADKNNVATACTALDTKVEGDSRAAAGQNYATLTTLAVRQAWGALCLAGTTATKYLFLKEISSDGDIQTVDVIFPFFPILMYMNPKLMKLMLDPLYINQNAKVEPPTVTYAIHDLGYYPNALGFPNPNSPPEEQPLEECGNMLIMTLAYAQKTSDVDYLRQNYALLNQWTGFLVNESLYPQNQISTDDFAGPLPNQTNLAVKGIIAIQAMAKIANMTGHTADGASYTKTAQSYIEKWQTLGINHNANPPHTTLNYGHDDTWGNLYNIYADSLLETQLVPKAVYQMQSDYYPQVIGKYGLPLDTRHPWIKSDWALFSAAVASDDTRDKIISSVAIWVDETPIGAPTVDWYDTNGDWPTKGGHFIARPVLGGWFSLLALNQTGIPNHN
ncbi:Hypothetical protein R9X50_00178300 [Acrodontium crateriforme]|uniref:Glutaminase GtaA n=1 Tax=Acrodontium crateriforme TaxID=150365 RepID=A0AAQ3M5S8_9PEZI|nr:Hypothetical protein R9X50_00178300 [Acrodontium crateriforme]